MMGWVNTSPFHQNCLPVGDTTHEPPAENPALLYILGRVASLEASRPRHGRCPDAELTER